MPGGSGLSGIRDCISWAAECKDRFVSDSQGLEILVLVKGGAGQFTTEEWNVSEWEIIELLQERPRTLDQLAQDTGCFTAKYLPLERLEQASYIQRCGLTPTDLLHAAGVVNFADSETAEALCRVYADIAGVSSTILIEELLLEVRKLLTLEMIKRELAGDVEVEGVEETPLVSLLLDNLYTEGNGSYQVGFELKHPIVGIGAPVRELLIPANEWLHTECIVPEHAEVANAVGAIISPVHIEKELRIEPSADGEFLLLGGSGELSFSEFAEAHQRAITELSGLVTQAAAESGAEDGLIRIAWRDKISDIYDEGATFIARVYTGETTGMPRI